MSSANPVAADGRGLPVILADGIIANGSNDLHLYSGTGAILVNQVPTVPFSVASKAYVDAAAGGDIAGLSNVGGGAGQIFDTVVAQVAQLRTLTSTGSTVTITTAGQTVNLDVDANLTLTSLDAPTITCNSISPSSGSDVSINAASGSIILGNGTLNQNIEINSSGGAYAVTFFAGETPIQLANSGNITCNAMGTNTGLINNIEPFSGTTVTFFASEPAATMTLHNDSGNLDLQGQTTTTQVVLTDGSTVLTAGTLYCDSLSSGNAGGDGAILLQVALDGNTHDITASNLPNCDFSTPPMAGQQLTWDAGTSRWVPGAAVDIDALRTEIAQLRTMIEKNGWTDVKVKK